MEVEPVLFGQYQLLDLIARGGMAEVYRAKSYGVEGFEKVLVIKRILPELSENPRFVDMFINEAKIAVTLSHANIVQVFDLGRAEGSYFIAMEYVAGLDLSQMMRRSRRSGLVVPQEIAVYLASEVAKGLDYAHRRKDSQMRPLGIIHRDVSPQNVLLSAEGEVKLTDFGIAKAALAVEAEHDDRGLKGKYAYMSPEQARGEQRLDARSDLFSLGVLLYEVLTGKNPFFTPDSDYETLRRVRDGDFRPIQEVEPSIPEELASLVNRVMAVDVDDRQPDAGHFYEDLVQFLYSTRRRVGAHHLAEFLRKLQAAEETTEGSAEDTALRAAFDTGAATTGRESYMPDATPVEVPVARTSPKSSPPPRKGVPPTTPPAPSREERQVTALVIRGSEGVLEETLFERLISRFGGVVPAHSEQGMTEERLLLFGVHQADGRDAQNAARWTRRLLSTLQSEDQAEGGGAAELSVGMHTSRIWIGVDQEPTPDATFEAFLDAARSVAEAAHVGQVLASETSQRALGSVFDTQRFEVPDGPIAYLVGEERRGHSGPGGFIGRRGSMRRLGDALSVANHHQMRFVVVRGDAGSGKSRILFEMEQRLRKAHRNVGIYRTHCASHNKGVPLSGLQAMLRAVLGAEEFDDVATLRQKVRRLRQLGLGSSEIRALAAVLGHSLEADEGAGGGQMLRPALVRMATKLAEDRLTVFIWDNADFLDAESRSILLGLLPELKDSRLAIVVAYPHDAQADWEYVPGQVDVVLGPLSDDEIGKMTADRLSATQLPATLLREVTLKSGGNPLYIEEYLGALKEAGAIRIDNDQVDYLSKVADDAVPKTLRGIIASRVAQLPQRDRHILQVASVLGERFKLRILLETMDLDEADLNSGLRVLEARHLITQLGEDYDFTHRLIREVIRDGMTLEDRRALHAAVASVLERMYPEHRDELAERLAGHYREAGNRHSAVECWVLAAARLQREHALSGAIENLVRAVRLISQMARPDRDRMIELYRQIGDLSFRSRRLSEGTQHMAAAVELCEALGREPDVARFSMLYGRLLVNDHSSLTKGDRWLERASSLARKLGDSPLLRDVILAKAEACMRLGDHGRAADGFEEALSIARDTGEYEPQVRCLIPLALARTSNGDLPGGLAALDEAKLLSSSHPDRFTECERLKIRCLVNVIGRNYDAALEAGHRALELAKEYSFTYEAAVNAHNLGELYLRRGDYKRAFGLLRYSFELGRDHGIEMMKWINMRLLGFIDATRFGSEEGRQHVVEANRFAENHGYVWDLIQGRYLLAIIDQQRGRDEDARRELRQVLRLAAQHGHRDYIDATEAALRALDESRPIELL